MLDTTRGKILDQEAENIVRSIRIPPCPSILTMLVREMRSDEPDFDIVGKLITRDVGLAAIMLKTVNSPFYGLPVKAVSVKQAIILLGLRNIVHLVTGLLLRQAFPVASPGLMEQFWEASSMTADLAAFVASHTRAVDRDHAYTYGLFRDCGIPLLLLEFPAYSETLARTHRNNGDLTALNLSVLEEEHCGIDHTEVGHYLAGSWHLPEETGLAIFWHHDYSVLDAGQPSLSKVSLNLIAAGFVADYLLGAYRGTAAAKDWGDHGAKALERLGIDVSELTSMSEEANRLYAH